MTASKWRAERRGQQKAEEQLHAGQRDADLVEELGPLALEALRKVAAASAVAWLAHRPHCTAPAPFG